MDDLLKILREKGIQPTPQRLEIARYVLDARNHPSADQVFESVRLNCPTVSRATIYNTLNLLVEKGLVVTQMLKEGAIAFDPRVERHHHFIDDETGEIYDIPWDTLEVSGVGSFGEFEVQEYNVVMRGRKKQRGGSR